MWGGPSPHRSQPRCNDQQSFHRDFFSSPFSPRAISGSFLCFSLPFLFSALHNGVKVNSLSNSAYLAYSQIPNQEWHFQSCIKCRIGANKKTAPSVAVTHENKQKKKQQPPKQTGNALKHVSSCVDTELKINPHSALQHTGRVS